jgi:thiamine monophosphate kinase
MGTPLIEIGKVTSDKNQILFDDGQEKHNIERRGWVHLA